MCKVYGYGRISRKTQNIDRQIRNILAAYPNAIIYKALDALLKQVKKGDTIVYDSVSRMSRNADEGCQLYEQLFNKGVELVFLKENHVNTAVYREALAKQIDISINNGDNATDTLMNTIIDALNKFQMDLAKKQIELAFGQAQKEVDDLHKRTSEGIETARLNGKQIGGVTGKKLTTKKSIEKKTEMRKHCIDFGGTLNDIDCMKLTGLSRNTYYKYKRELKADILDHDIVFLEQAK